MPIVDYILAVLLGTMLFMIYELFLLIVAAFYLQQIKSLLDINTEVFVSWDNNMKKIKFICEYVEQPGTSDQKIEECTELIKLIADINKVYNKTARENHEKVDVINKKIGYILDAVALKVWREES